MGKIIRFRKRPRRNGVWTKPDAYSQPRRRAKKSAKARWAEPIRQTRVPLLIVFCLTITAILATREGYRSRFGEWLAPTEVAREEVSGQFTRCGPGRGYYCVIDGDTFKLGQRDIRVVGIDAPEVEARCPAEAVGAERATAALQAWLNQGPFTLIAYVGNEIDKYGRDLRVVRRESAEGEGEDAADALVREGVVRRYGGGSRGVWC